MGNLLRTIFSLTVIAPPPTPLNPLRNSACINSAHSAVIVFFFASLTLKKIIACCEKSNVRTYECLLSAEAMALMTAEWNASGPLRLSAVKCILHYGQGFPVLKKRHTVSTIGFLILSMFVLRYINGEFRF